MPTKLYVHQGDSGPVPAFTLVDQQGNPIDLNNATVKFRMVSYHTGAVRVNDRDARILQASGQSETGVGQVEYIWQDPLYNPDLGRDASPDTAVCGLYKAYWILKLANAGPEVYPNNDSFWILISERK